MNEYMLHGLIKKHARFKTTLFLVKNKSTPFFRGAIHMGHPVYCDIVTKNNRQQPLFVPGISRGNISSFAKWFERHDQKLRSKTRDYKHKFALIKLVHGTLQKDHKSIEQALRDLEKVLNLTKSRSFKSTYNGFLALEDKNDWDGIAYARNKWYLSVYYYNEAKKHANKRIYTSYLISLSKVCESYEKLNTLMVVPSVSNQYYLRECRALKINLAKQHFKTLGTSNYEKEVIEREDVELLLIQKTWFSSYIMDNDIKDSYNRCVEKIIKYDFNQEFVFNLLKDAVESFAEMVYEVKNDIINKKVKSPPGLSFIVLHDFKKTSSFNEAENLQLFVESCNEFVNCLKGLVLERQEPIL